MQTHIPSRRRSPALSFMAMGFSHSLDPHPVKGFIGPPGGGKGTQSKRLAERFEWSRLETGERCREERRNRTPLGIQFEEHIQGGGLVPDDLIYAMVGQEVEDFVRSGDGILDGFPRNIAQGIWFHNLLRNYRRDFVVHYLEVPDEECVRRMMLRESGRDDDKCEAVIRERLRVYHLETDRLLDYFYEEADKPSSCIKFVYVRGTLSEELIFRLISRTHTNAIGSQRTHR